MRDVRTMSKRLGGAAMALIGACLWFAASAVPGQAAGPSLYDRLGGKAAIVAVVDDFAARQLADDRLAKYYEHTDKAAWKGYLVDLICASSGGPCTYTGRAMNVAHARKYITDDQFNWTAEHLVAALDHFKVAKADRDELVGIVASLKEQIVGW